MVVYVDVLIVLNLYINYFLIRASAVMLRRVCTRKRCVLAALAGAAGSLVILLPELPFPVVTLIKITLGTLIVFIAFGKQKPADLAVCVLFFLVVSFIFAGAMLALWMFAAPLGMVWSNGTAYFNIPLSAVAAFTAAAYCAVRLVRYLADRRLHCERICAVKIATNGCAVKLRGLCDTGNELCDLLSGKHIVICRYEKIAPIAPSNALEYFDGKLSESLRVVPCRTVAAQTLVPIFKADITIDGRSADGFVGITKSPLGEDVDCIFNPKIISI